MLAADLDVWIDSQVGAQQTVVVPYVRSASSRWMHYRLDVVKQGRAGNTRMSQSGNVLAEADKAVALSRTSFRVEPGDACTLEISLRDKDLTLGSFRFDCPR